MDTDDFGYSNGSKNNNSSKNFNSPKGFKSSKNINDSKHFDGSIHSRPFRNSERFDRESVSAYREGIELITVESFLTQNHEQTLIQYALLPEQTLVTRLPASSLRRFHRQTHHEGCLEI